jgi:hypothetical protein
MSLPPHTVEAMRTAVDDCLAQSTEISVIRCFQICLQHASIFRESESFRATVREKYDHCIEKARQRSWNNLLCVLEDVHIAYDL